MKYFAIIIGLIICSVAVASGLSHHSESAVTMGYPTNLTCPSGQHIASMQQKCGNNGIGGVSCMITSVQCS